MRARRWWAWPLVPVYAAGLAVKDGLRQVYTAMRIQSPHNAADDVPNEPSVKVPH